MNVRPYISTANEHGGAFHDDDVDESSVPFYKYNQTTHYRRKVKCMLNVKNIPCSVNGTIAIMGIRRLVDRNSGNNTFHPRLPAKKLDGMADRFLRVWMMV